MDGRFRWVAALAAALSLALAGQASAHVYWSDTSAIGRANPDGSFPDHSFLGADAPMGMAAAGPWVYWASATGSIGRAKVDGSSVEPGFINLGKLSPLAVAVDGEHVYWIMRHGLGLGNLDGTGVARLMWLFSNDSPIGVAVSGGHYYLAFEGSDSIARMDFDGSNWDRDFITGAGNPTGLAVDGQHLYWASSSGNMIGRSNLDGSDVERSFIAGAARPLAVSVDEEHVYWTNAPGDRPGTIGRANRDGSGADQSFITTAATTPWGLAVDGAPAGRAQASAGSLTFGSASSMETLTVTNEGHGNLNVDAARVDGADSDDFRIGADGCANRTLSIGEECTIGVRFAPRASGPRAATLVVASDDRFSPLEIALAGSVDDPAPTAVGAPATAPPAVAPRSTPSLVVCRKLHGRRRCATRRLLGDAPLPATGTARASLVQHGALYATGTATADRLTLTARRPVPAGAYTLTLRAGGRITARARISIR
jgi:hypothetical protein